jgi:hypothetical protein
MGRQQARGLDFSADAAKVMLEQFGSGALGGRVMI